MAGDTDILAGESAADGIGSNSICSEASGGESSDIVVTGNVWPVVGEDFPAIGVDLAERDGSHSGSFEPEAEAANS